MTKKSLFIVFLILFIDLLGFGIVIPILPFYAKEFGATATVIGWLMASFSIMQFFFSPLWGKLSDHIGRRPVLLISVFGSAIAYLIMGWAGSLFGLFIGRVLGGISSGNLSTAYAYITDITTDENRAKGMGMLGAAFGLGFTMGPGIGGVLSHYGHEMPMYFASALALANTIFGFFYLQEPPRHKSIDQEFKKKTRFELIKHSLAHATTALPIFLYFIMTLAITQVEVVFPIYMGDFFGFDAQKTGYIMAASGIVMVIIQGGLIGRLTRRYGEKKLVFIGAIIGVVALGVFGSTLSLSIGVGALMGLALGRGLLHPALSSLTSMGAHSSERGAVMGVFQSSGSLARIIGPPTAGFCYDALTPRSPFYTAGGLMLIVLLLAFFNRQRFKKT